VVVGVLPALEVASVLRMVSSFNSEGEERLSREEDIEGGFWELWSDATDDARLLLRRTRFLFGTEDGGGIDVMGVVALLRGEGCLTAPPRPRPRTGALAAGGPPDFEEVVRLSLGPSRIMVPASSCNLCNSRLRVLLLEVSWFDGCRCGDTVASWPNESR